MAPDLTWTAVETPLGLLGVAVSASGIVGTDIAASTEVLVAELTAHFGASIERDDRGLDRVRAEAEGYFRRRTRTLRTPVDLTFATGFSHRVYKATMRVPYGELRTYGDVAAEAGSPRAFRAAGTALRHCPIELWIPCHRVVPAGPGFGTYGGHPERREFLLRLEGAI